MIVKTYPSPSTKYHETVCTAGITKEGQLIRLYPIVFRYLDEEKQFEKFRWIEAEIKKNEKDSRPESYKIQYESIRLLNRLDAKKNAEERRRYIIPHIKPSLEAIQEEYNINKTSLGIFKPKKIIDFKIEETTKEWTDKEKSLLNQISMYDRENIGTLEKIPYDFSFVFECDDSSHKIHTMKITDWEICQAYRNFKKKYGKEKAKQYVKEKWMKMFTNEDTEAYFITGNTYRFKTFIILGVINLKKHIQYSMFD